MTNRLHILERERERLEMVLADDPHWQAFCEAQKRDPTAGRLHVLSSDVVAGLTQSRSFAAYIKVVRAIDRIRANAPPTQTQNPRHAVNGSKQTFRTRLNVKPMPSSSHSDVPLVRVDDLTAIRRIDRELEKALNALGLYSYQAIAEWNRHNVRSVCDTLQLSKRIWRENWIEQAALLQLRQLETSNTAALKHEPAKSLAGPPPNKLIASLPTEQATHEPAPSLAETVPQELHPKPTEPASSGATPAIEASPIVAAAPLPETVRASAPTNAIAASPASSPEAHVSEAAHSTSSQPELPSRPTIKVGRRPRRLPAPTTRRFSYLFGVSDQMSEALRSAGVKSIAEIAAWSRSDVRWFQAILGHEARISRDQWIEQAALLSKGRWTQHALRVVSGETRLVVPSPPPLRLGTPALGVMQPVARDAVVAAEQAKTVAAVPAAETASTELANPPDAPVPDGVLTGAEDDATEAVAIVPVAVIAIPESPAPALKAQQGPDHPAMPPELPAPELTADKAIATTENTEDLSKALPPPLKPVEHVNRPQGRSALGKIKRPPPDLGTRKRHVPQPEPMLPPPIPDPMPLPPIASDTVVPTPRPSPLIINEIDEPIPVEPVADTAMPDLDLADDWDDAEALVIKRSEPVAAPVSLQAEVKEPSLPTTEPPVTNPVPSAPSQTDDVAEDEPSWGDEAEVVIVSRQRTKAEPPTSEPVPAATHQGVNQTGASPRVVDRQHMPNARRFDEDDLSTPQVGYRDTIDEASVTIIRAEASQENAASVVPSEIANDADAPQQPIRRTSARAIGSRFLKALTGN